MKETKNRCLGALIGLAIGNALGAPFEYIDMEKLPEINDFHSGGIYNLNAGEWTDDVSMALCLAESLIEDGFDFDSQMKKYLKWIDEGLYSCKKTAFGIDNQTMDALIQYEKDASLPKIIDKDSHKPLARLAPIPMYFKNSFNDAVFYSGQSAYTTHNNIYSIHSCKFIGGFIQQAINGATKRVLLEEVHRHMDLIYDVKLKIVDVTYKDINDLINDGKAINSLEIALWTIYNTNSFKDAVLTAVRFGGDTDTLGAIVGQMAGALYGLENIPKVWLLKLAKKDMILELAEKLCNK
ncbi:hypothetical protein XO10_04120 [Marinitoga sp. 1135]|uniref:ADP-ribosylglycohydrolase family protein n=1 Tax=unclassified Marinitoga TaxID=2640159 RepID=UPI00158613ED|nr:MULTISPECIES: ADP-ribosylglycohydrolase family protein [unclassified Marinitoga]NUU95476.1 hypothetical protein [Marinitoga sp. 1135]NUU97404.1 hypothetical protein [Marinitoga sp. 1138]